MWVRVCVRVGSLGGISGPRARHSSLASLACVIRFSPIAHRRTAMVQQPDLKTGHKQDDFKGITQATAHMCLNIVLTWGSPGRPIIAASCRHRWFHRVWQDDSPPSAGMIPSSWVQRRPPRFMRHRPCVDRGPVANRRAQPQSKVLSQGWTERPGRPPLEVQPQGAVGRGRGQVQSKPSHKMRPRVIFLTPDRWFHRGALACPGHARDVTESRKGLDPCAKTYKVGRQMVPRFAAGLLTPPDERGWRGRCIV